MTQPDEDLTLVENDLDPDDPDRIPLGGDLAGGDMVDSTPSGLAGMPGLTTRAVPVSLPFEADEYDALEQAQVVPDADDDYR